MSYLKKLEYEIIPTESFSVIRNCSGCGTKMHYINTKRFRVNANGNKLDVWLIYQCEKCKHTLNLTIYERRTATSIPKEEYRRFLSNNEELAEEYGKKMSFFQDNRAEIDWGNIPCGYIKKSETELTTVAGYETQLVIQNPYRLKIRAEKQLSEVLGVSVNRIKRLAEQEIIRFDIISSQLVSVYVKDCPNIKGASVQTT